TPPCVSYTSKLIFAPSHHLTRLSSRHGLHRPSLCFLIFWRRTLPVSCGPQEKTPGIAPKACPVGRQLHWVVRLVTPLARPCNRWAVPGKAQNVCQDST